MGNFFKYLSAMLLSFIAAIAFWDKWSKPKSVTNVEHNTKIKGNRGTIDTVTETNVIPESKLSRKERKALRREERRKKREERKNKRNADKGRDK